MNKDQAYYAKKYKQMGRHKKTAIYHGLWFDPNLNRFVDCGRGRPGYSSFLKRACNKKLRRRDIEPSSMRSYYRKNTEFWWELY